MKRVLGVYRSVAFRWKCVYVFSMGFNRFWCIVSLTQAIMMLECLRISLLHWWTQWMSRLQLRFVIWYILFGVMICDTNRIDFLLNRIQWTIYYVSLKCFLYERKFAHPVRMQISTTTPNRRNSPAFSKTPTSKKNSGGEKTDRRDVVNTTPSDSYWDVNGGQVLRVSISRFSVLEPTKSTHRILKNERSFVFS